MSENYWQIIKSAQSAFLYNITSNVKSISLSKVNSTILIRCYFYKPPSDNDMQHIQDAGGEIWGDLMAARDYEVEFLLGGVDDVHLERLIFARAEY